MKIPKINFYDVITSVLYRHVPVDIFWFLLVVSLNVFNGVICSSTIYCLNAPVLERALSSLQQVLFIDLGKASSCDFLYHYITQGVPSNASWEAAMKMIVTDPRYL